MSTHHLPPTVRESAPMTAHHLAPPPRPRHEPPWLEQPVVVPPRPRAVTVSTVLWLAAVAVGAASIVLTLADLDQVRASVLADVARQLPNELPATRDRVATAVLAVIAGGGAVIMLLQLGFALALSARRRWARVALVLVALLGLGYDLIAAGAVPQPVLIGVAAAAALAGAVAMFLPVSSRWLAARPGRGGWR